MIKLDELYKELKSINLLSEVYIKNEVLYLKAPSYHILQNKDKKHIRLVKRTEDLDLCYINKSKDGFLAMTNDNLFNYIKKCKIDNKKLYLQQEADF